MGIFTEAAIKLLEMPGQVLWGFKPNLMRSIGEQHGAAKALTWFVRNMPRYEKTVKDWGPIRTHLLVTEISVLNGCPYCTYGHAYALQLHYFKETGQLLPVDENEMVAWHTLSEAEAIGQFRSLIQSSKLIGEHQTLGRMLVLRQDNEQPASKEDDQILHLVKMFSFLNQCGISGKTRLDQAHDAINKDAALRKPFSLLQRRGTEIPSPPRALSVDPVSRCVHPGYIRRGACCVLS